MHKINMQLCTAHVNNADTVGKLLITSWVACLRLTTYNKAHHTYIRGSCITICHFPDAHWQFNQKYC